MIRLRWDSVSVSESRWPLWQTMQPTVSVPVSLPPFCSGRGHVAADAALRPEGVAALGVGERREELLGGDVELRVRVVALVLLLDGEVVPVAAVLRGGDAGQHQEDGGEGQEEPVQTGSHVPGWTPGWPRRRSHCQVKAVPRKKTPITTNATASMM